MGSSIQSGAEHSTPKRHSAFDGAGDSLACGGSHRFGSGAEGDFDQPIVSTFSRSKLGAVLIGTAIGDSVGLAAEGLSRKRIKKLGWGGENWRQRLFFGRGMCSDDTEHSVMVLQSILEADGDVSVFRKRFARRLRWWLLGLPAGVGMATAKAVIKLWFGVNSKRSGVFSAGNGPAMRSAIIGAYFADEPEQRAEFVRASAELTHSDPKALVAAMAMAELAAAPDLAKAEMIELLKKLGSGDEEWSSLVEKMSQEKSVDEFADSIGAGKGVSGYAYRSVPVAIYAWMLHRGDSRKVIASALDCGGDTDTVAAMAGALCGASHGVSFFPGEWLAGLMEWPRGIAFIKRLAQCPARVPKVFWGWLLVRNLFFLLVVLMHGFLRIVPGVLRLFR